MNKYAQPPQSTLTHSEYLKNGKHFIWGLQSEYTIFLLIQIKKFPLDYNVPIL